MYQKEMKTHECLVNVALVKSRCSFIDVPGLVLDRIVQFISNVSLFRLVVTVVLTV